MTLNSQSGSYVGKQPLRDKNRLRLLTLLLLSLVTLCGCTSTGIRTGMNTTALSEIKSLCVKVAVNEEFTVSVRQVGEFSPPGIVEVGVARQIIKVVEDNVHAEELKNTLGDLDIKGALGSQIVDGLQRSGRFVTVTPVTVKKSVMSSGDGLLIIKIKNWGLMSALIKDSPSKGQVALEADVSIVREGDSLPIWERADYVTGDSSYSVERFNDAEFLKSEIGKLLTKYSNRVVNEIRYAN